MNAEQLRAAQMPLKKRYRDDPPSALVTMRAEGRIEAERMICTVGTFAGPVEAGLNPAAGGEGHTACSGDMLLEALVACAGVTLRAVATAMGVSLRGGLITAEGDLDFRGTLGVSRDVPVGFKAIRLNFNLDTNAPPEQVATLLKLTERYCVIYQTLVSPPKIMASHQISPV
jgi:uncharacterized OsmC-like protein